MSPSKSGDIMIVSNGNLRGGLEDSIHPEKGCCKVSGNTEVFENFLLGDVLHKSHV